tara:strand:- start:309 stop:641 length:333 start_codon:yes stop_codon:yes gene_type:complete
MTSRIHFRLADDQNNGHALWSGALTVQNKLSRPQARRVVAKHLGVKTLPARTLVLSDHDLEKGNWTADEIRAETSPLSRPVRAKRVVKSIHDVPTSFDEVQDMLKKFGLA